MTQLADSAMPLGTGTKPRHYFPFALTLLIGAIAIGGFWGSYFGPLLTGRSEAQTVLHLHAAVYVAWVALFIGQVGLVAVGRVDLHRRVGRLGIALGITVLAVGIATTLIRFAAWVQAGPLNQAIANAVWPLLDMVLFAAFFGLAVRWRRRPARHKRLMLVAMVTLLIAPIARLVPTDPPADGSWFFSNSAATHLMFLVLWMAPLLLALAYDVVRRQGWHPAYVTGIAVLAVSSFRDQLVGTAVWASFGGWLAAVVS
jgi:hypothetical protein